MYEKMKFIVLAWLEDNYSYCKQDDGTFQFDIEADYRDEFSNGDAKNICTDNDPYGRLYEILDEVYSEIEAQYLNGLEDEIIKNIESENEDFQNGMTYEEENTLSEILREYVYYKFPYDHYLDQEFCVNIMLDTGDGNYDFTLNSIYPCYYGEYEEKIDDKSSLLWLAKQQGYKKSQLWNVMRAEDESDYGLFLKSCREEVVNLPSHMATLTFLVKMSLRDLIELNRGIKLKDRNGKKYDARKYPYCGYIIIDKSATTGLFDPWFGGGSTFDIELEKDVRVPIRFIWSALPDGCDDVSNYGVNNVYGMTEAAWDAEVKKIQIPDLEKESTNES